MTYKIYMGVGWGGGGILRVNNTRVYEGLAGGEVNELWVCSIPIFWRETPERQGIERVNIDNNQLSEY